MLVILDDSALEIEIVAPSNWLTWLKTGQVLSILVDETNVEVIAKLDRIGAEVDPVSQTVKVFAKITESHTSILAGMSGTVSFNKGS
jgi:predicted transcriptional regulator